MKKTLSFITLFVLAISAFAQDVPQKMNYQAVARTAGGTVIANQEITLRIAIMSSDDLEAPVYAEEQLITTNKLGLMNLQIGAGDVLEGDMRSIDWGSAAHYLTILMDADNSGNFQKMGTSQLLTVPYAFYAEKSGSAEQGGNKNDPNDWTINGNTGTDDALNFLGTTDAQDLVFKTNSVEVGRFQTDGDLNLAATTRILNGGANLLSIGNLTNTYIGTATDHSSNTGDDNMFIGNIAGRDNTTGSDNVFIGNRAGRQNTSGISNIYMGPFAGMLGTTASNNIMIGYKAGQNNTSGNFNTFMGRLAGFGNTTGRYNLAIGSEAGESNQTGWANSFIGFKAGEKVTSDYNTAIGYLAGNTITTGTQNTFIGYRADGSATIENATAIGADASVTQSNSVVLGNNANVGIGTSAPAYKLDVKGDVSVTGRYIDSSGDAGASGQVLSSTVTGTDWIDASGGGVGSVGPTGATGPTGPQGFVGSSGPRGSDGADGADGLSAYEVAVNNGFVGTEAAWLLSLEGADGATGPQGPTGPAGADGTNGLDGADGATGATGATGPQGPAGADGTPGPTGPTGVFTILSDTDNDTKIQVEESADDDVIRFDVRGGELMRLERSAGNVPLIAVPNSYKSVVLGDSAGTNLNPIGGVIGQGNSIVGYQAGFNANTAYANVFTGYQAGYSTQNSAQNVFIGYQSGYSTTSGGDNTFLGYRAGYSNTAATNNIYIGKDAGFSNSGVGNTISGSGAGYSMTSGSANVMMGLQAGYSNLTGGGNIFIGYRAGYSETGSNKLYIENSNSTTPLIYGQFDNDIVGINGSLGVGTQSPQDELHVEGSIRMVDGNQQTGRILVSNANGTMTWTDPSAFYDADDLGNHTATQNIQLDDNWLSNDGGDEGLKVSNTGVVSIKTTATSSVVGLEIDSKNASILQLKQNTGVGYPEQRWNVGGNDVNFYIQDVTSSDKIPFKIEKGTPTNTLYLDDTGAVGVGTTSPNFKTHIHDGSSTWLQLTNTASGTASGDGMLVGISDNDARVQVRENLPLVFQTNDEERMRISSDGNIGIGTTSPNFNTHIHDDSSTSTWLQLTNTATGTAFGDGMLVGISNLGARIQVLEDLPLVFDGEVAEWMRITSDGNVGIGTNSPVSKLHVAPSSGIGITIDRAGGEPSLEGGTSSGDWLIADGNVANNGKVGLNYYSGGDVILANGGGNAGVGTTAPTSKLHVKDNFAGAGEFVVTIENLDNGEYSNGLEIKAGQNTQSVNNRMISFVRPSGSEIGAVRQVTSTSVSYNTTSDERLKTNIQPTAKGLSDLMQIEVKDYLYKDDLDKPQTGFIAQQVYEHYPNAVSVGGDDVKTDPWMMDYGQMSPLLVKAIQELSDKVQALENENATLKAELTTEKKSNQERLQLIEEQLGVGLKAQK